MLWPCVLGSVAFVALVLLLWGAGWVWDLVVDAIATGESVCEWLSDNWLER